MNPYDFCDSCGGPMDGSFILRDLSMDGCEIHVCRSCAEYFLTRDNAQEPRFVLVGEDTYGRVNAAAASYRQPYDQAMAQYHEEMAAVETAERRRVANIALNQQFGPMLDHDAVLDAYIDANPDKFTYVAYTDNTEDTRLAGLRQWHDLRQSAIGG